MKRPLLIVGAFGIDNYGNEASLRAALDNLTPGRQQVVVACLNPSKVEADHGVAATALCRPIRAARLPKMLKKFLEVYHVFGLVGRSRAVIVPGTGVLEGIWVQGGGLPLLLLASALAARVLGRPFLLLSIGVDTSGSILTRRIYGSVLRLAHYVSVRDGVSRDAALQLGCRHAPRVVPDLALALEIPIRDSIAVRECERELALGVMDYSGPHVEANPLARASYLESMAEIVAYSVERDWRVTLFRGAAPDDAAIGELLARLDVEAQAAGRIVVARATNYVDLVKEVSAATVMIASRYHNLVGAVAACVPSVAIAYGDKQIALLEDRGMSPNFMLDSFEPRAVLECAFSLAARRDLWAQRLAVSDDDARKDLAAQFKLVMALTATPVASGG